MDTFIRDLDPVAIASTILASLLLALVVASFKRVRALLRRLWAALTASPEERKHLARLRAEERHRVELAAAQDAQRRKRSRLAAAQTIDQKVRRVLLALRELPQSELDAVALFVLAGQQHEWQEFRRHVTNTMRTLTPHGSQLGTALRQMSDVDYVPATGNLGLDLDALLQRILDLARAELDGTEPPELHSDLQPILDRCAAIDGDREKARREQIRQGLDKAA